MASERLREPVLVARQGRVDASGSGVTAFERDLGEGVFLKPSRQDGVVPAIESTQAVAHAPVRARKVKSRTLLET